MANSLYSGRQRAATPRPNAFRAILCWLAEARARRRQRVALARLLEAHPTLLNDIGVEPRDIAEAMTVSHAHAASLFETRRRQAFEDLPRR